MDLCKACYDGLCKLESYCTCCAKKFEVSSPKPRLCGACQKNSPAFDHTYAPFIHQGAMRYLIKQLKFNGDYKNSRILGQLLAQHLANNTERPELIMPVPLHPKRYRQRGFNQSLEIAKIVAQELSIPVNTRYCQRNKDTQHQTSLTAKQRRKNIKNAFQLITVPSCKHIAILDDVLTTGATANELAKLLKSVGVKRVDVWVCARA